MVSTGGKNHQSSPSDKSKKEIKSRGGSRLTDKITYGFSDSEDPCVLGPTALEPPPASSLGIACRDGG